LGEKYTFNTELLTDGKVEAGILEGNLYIKGKGDPTLLVSDLENMVKELKSTGVQKVQGNLIADDTWYDDVRLSIDLPWSDETTYYGAQISALTLAPNDDYDAGTVIVEAKSNSKQGQPPIVNITPKSTYMSIENKAVTVEADKPKTLKIERNHGENTIVISGEIPAGGIRSKEWVSVWEPTEYTAHIFRELLLKNGIEHDGQVKIAKTPEKATKVSTHSSIELADLLLYFMKFSNNGHGEVLVKELGRVVKGKGSWEEGIEVVQEELAKWGLDSSSYLIRDGSGISHVNLISATQISKLLYEIQDERWHDYYLNALPLASSSDRLLAGTLLHRMAGISDQSIVRAKTGTLTSVSSLSGYIISKGGNTYVFSILLNNLLDEEKGKQLEDQIVEVLANQ
jgi:D-alanyl-D-alanine carboxypeptidase/D-alanyl-D-alanine-endopeptidase (penicillin-binding protein 4)